MPLALIRLPRRRSIVSSMPSSTGPLGAKAAIRRPSSRRAAVRPSQAARVSTRWELGNRRSRPRPTIRKRLVTVRLPGARMAPISSSSARRQVRCCTNTGAKVRMREAKQAGRCMAASLGRDVPVYRSPAPPPRPRRALRRCHACPEWPKSRISDVRITKTAYPERSGWGGDDLAVSGGPGLDGLLDQPGEAVADEGGGAAVEPEDVLVEGGGEGLLPHRAGGGGGEPVLLAHRGVVGAEEPALGEAEDEVDAGQPERGVAPGGARADRLVVVAPRRQAQAAAPPVGGHGRRLGDVGGEEALEARGRGVGQRGEPGPAEAAAAG